MKKFLLQFVFILILAWVLEQFLPWWSVALAGLTGSVLIRAPYSFWCGFLAIAVLWLVTASYIHVQAAQPLVSQIARLMHMKSYMLFAVTGITGGIAGGLGAWSGAALYHFSRS